MNKLNLALIYSMLSLPVIHYGALAVTAAENYTIDAYTSAKRSAEAYIASSLGLVPFVPPEPELTAMELLEREALYQGVSPQIARAIVDTETKGRHNSRSEVGAIGLMQVMPANAKRCGLKTSDALWDLKTNIQCGVQILREELENYKGDITKAARVYNAGPKGLRIKIPETEAYAAAVERYIVKTTPTLLASR